MKIILSKSEKIVDNHISRARRGEITIHSNTGTKSNAATIIYAIRVSNEDMPKITGERLSELAGVSRTLIPTLYRKWYKDLAQRYKFNFSECSNKRGYQDVIFMLF